MKKIMFNDKYGLTTAVLEGGKKMTRRIAYIGELNKPNSGYLTEGKLRGTCALCDSNSIVAKSLYKVGEVVAVAQKYEDVLDEYIAETYRHEVPTPDNFKPFGEQSNVTLPYTLPGGRNKMFVRAELMPHQIRITNIRVERLQDISDEDCLKEGIMSGCKIFMDLADRECYGPTTYAIDYCDKDFLTPQGAFSYLIDKVSSKGTWQANPYCFCYTFELVR